ncbi:hypothetical protein C5167_044888 [Papaver somniferum]|uniref:Uncharacterized protein n=1 Tax=Papaver somniferum TaxID=3469 RepID=A0A4Y7LD36_PAPSO|nr:hypothetical protein C5167_044888 [Papaver somniferum]
MMIYHDSAVNTTSLRREIRDPGRSRHHYSGKRWVTRTARFAQSWCDVSVVMVTESSRGTEPNIILI